MQRERTIVTTGTSGRGDVDLVLKHVVEAYEGQFPDRVRGYYLVGSNIEGSAVALSDIDLYVAFKGALGKDEEVGAQELARRCGERSPMRLDVVIRGEDALGALPSMLRVVLKHGSVLVYGEDIRPAVAMPSLEEYTRDVARSALTFITRVLRGVERAEYPLDYPDPEEEFYGYARKRVDVWYPAAQTTGTKELVATVSRMSTALLAAKAERFATTKGESVKLYRECVGDEWAPFIEAIYEQCKLRWEYKVPGAEGERLMLRKFCGDMLAFENYFLRQFPNSEAT